MDTNLTIFRAEVRQFLASELSEELRRRTREATFSTREDIQHWARILHARGWSVPGWPVEHGGTGWSPIQEELCYIEQALADAPEISPFGIFMIGPVLIEFGSAWQKDRYLPGIRDSSELWCQGFSEPNSGSDLASLQTRAERAGDHYVVNGQKIWTSTAHFADYMFCLVRTERTATKQRGISMVLVDMHAPGVSVQPIVTIDGAHYLNQVFFDDVRVEIRNLVGEEGEGWRYAKFLLERERVSSAFLPKIKSDMARLRKLFGHLYQGEREEAHVLSLDRKIARLECQAMAHEMAVYRILTNQSGFDGLSAAAMVKITGANLHKAIAQLIVEMLGPEGLLSRVDVLADESWREEISSIGSAEEYCMSRAYSVFGGTNEIQHEIIAKNGLRL